MSSRPSRPSHCFKFHPVVLAAFEHRPLAMSSVYRSSSASLGPRLVSPLSSKSGVRLHLLFLRFCPRSPAPLVPTQLGLFFVSGSIVTHCMRILFPVFSICSPTCFFVPAFLRPLPLFTSALSTRLFYLSTARSLRRLRFLFQFLAPPSTYREVVRS